MDSLGSLFQGEHLTCGQYTIFLNQIKLLQDVVQSADFRNKICKEDTHIWQKYFLIETPGFRHSHHFLFKAYN